ncbi:hypothetical protein IV203_002510 [Nitzschia inconspicua]|uniref:Uncharacterized protein n=1 Tax=Nitzschia inconspicua TaxID=303405 RepID=A0A9K3P9P8_9STRA|nr:hypothetical protein IV203_002510 [Nitzschia inconspicua]
MSLQTQEKDSEEGKNSTLTMVSDSCDTSDKEIKPSQAEGEEKTMDVSCSTTETTTKKCGLEGCCKNATEIWKDNTTNIEVLLCSDCEKIQGQNMSKVESPSLGLTIEEASSADANLVDEDNAIIATPKSDNNGEEDEHQKQVEEEDEEEEEEEEEGGSFALIDFVSLAKLKTGGDSVIFAFNHTRTMLRLPSLSLPALFGNLPKTRDRKSGTTVLIAL